MVTVSAVRGRRDRRDFIGLPYRLYAGSPYWVPPLRISIKRQLAFAARPGGELTAEHFIARTPEGRCVGRIAAAIHAPYTERYGPVGFFGFFECEQDHSAGSALLAAAEAWLRQRGMKEVSGPYSYTTAQDVGLLTEGFDTPCSLLQPYHPPYYREIVESCGYGQKYGSSAFMLTRREPGPADPRIAARGQKAMARAGLAVRCASGDYEQEMELIRELYNRSFAGSPDSVPVGRSLFHFLAGDLRRLLKPELVQIIEQHGQPVGFLVMFPEISSILRKCRGSVLRYILNERHVRRQRSVVVVMMGAEPGSVGLGVGRCIAGQIAQLADTAIGYDSVYTTRVHQDNALCRSLLASLGAVEHKRYAVFGKCL